MVTWPGLKLKLVKGRQILVDLQMSWLWSMKAKEESWPEAKFGISNWKEVAIYRGTVTAGGSAWVGWRTGAQFGYVVFVYVKRCGEDSWINEFEIERKGLAWRNEFGIHECTLLESIEWIIILSLTTEYLLCVIETTKSSTGKYRDNDTRNYSFN